MSAKIVDLTQRQVEQSRGKWLATGEVTRVKRGTPLAEALAAQPGAVVIDGDWLNEKLNALTEAQLHHLCTVARLGAMLRYGSCMEALVIDMAYQILKAIDAGETPPIPGGGRHG